jgi:hypothetical protein
MALWPFRARVVMVRAAIVNVQKHFTPYVSISSKLMLMGVLLNLGLQIWHEQCINDVMRTVNDVSIQPNSMTS